MSQKTKVFQVITGQTWEGFRYNEYWKVFTNEQDAIKYAENLDSVSSMEYDYVAIIDSILE